MPYPLSSEVSSGQPTAYQHYNNLLADALYLGVDDLDAVTLGSLLSRYIQNVRLDYLATNRLRVPWSTTTPPIIVINGYMLKATANVDLAASSFSGGAATWYVFAVRSNDLTTFTLSINTSSSEATDTRLIGEVYWDGSNITRTSIKTYHLVSLGKADYDSGWYAVTLNTTYTKAHGLSISPSLVQLLHSAVADPDVGGAGTYELVKVNGAYDAGSLYCDLIGWDYTSVFVKTANHASYGCVFSLRRYSSAGYHKILAWK